MTEPGVVELPEGAELAHFRVESILGKGGMGTVYRALDTALDRPVALKVLRPEVAHDPSVVDRFVREARAAARVSHPNLTHVYFVGTKDDRPFFAMEYCPGTTVEVRVKERGPFDLGPGIDVLVQAARGLAAAHEAGVVHRDVKPSNLMLLPDGTLKVADFGLAKSLRGDVEATGGGRVMGTPTYITPEQCRGREIDGRTDVYLLGLTAWFLFTGQPAYSSDQLAEVIDAQLNRPLPDLTGLRPDLPPALQSLLARMCAKDPAKRPGSMAEVAALLEALRPRAIQPAPIIARAFALAIDFAVFLLLVAVVLGIEGALRGFLGIGIPEVVKEVATSGLLALSQLGLEGWAGTTVGKWALQLRVCRHDGTPAGWRALGLRFLLRFPIVVGFAIPASGVLVAVVMGVQGLAMAAGLVTWFFTRGRTLSDLLTGTRVVYRFRRGDAHS